MGLALAYYFNFNCFEESVCNPDGAGGCLPGPCGVEAAWQRWMLPTLGALVGLGIASAWQAFRRSRQRAERPGVRLTVLSKVLHRKRPDLIPLYDQNIQRCYLGGSEPRIATVKARSWTEFARSWIPEVRGDLTTQLPAWVTLAELAPGSTPVTPLRALDMIGWQLGAA